MDSLLTLAKGSDVLIEQCMGPIKDFAALPNNSQYLLNVSLPGSCIAVEANSCVLPAWLLHHHKSYCHKQSVNHSITCSKKKRKDYAFRRQFNEKPGIIPGCPDHMFYP